MSGRWFTKKPCAHCPFRADVPPFLHPSRAADLAYLTLSSYNRFTCHKTIDYSDAEDGEGLVTTESLECAGFLSMQVQNGMRCPTGFEPSDLVYSEPSEMADAYEAAAEERRVSTLPLQEASPFPLLGAL